MDTIWLFFAGFTVSGFLMGYGLCLIRHRKAIYAWRQVLIARGELANAYRIVRNASIRTKPQYLD